MPQFLYGREGAIVCYCNSNDPGTVQRTCAIQCHEKHTSLVNNTRAGLYCSSTGNRKFTRSQINLNTQASVHFD